MHLPYLILRPGVALLGEGSKRLKRGLVIAANPSSNPEAITYPGPGAAPKKPNTIKIVKNRVTPSHLQHNKFNKY
jgi:hypothetical protein